MRDIHQCVETSLVFHIPQHPIICSVSHVTCSFNWNHEISKWIITTICITMCQEIMIYLTFCQRLRIGSRLQVFPKAYDAVHSQSLLCLEKLRFFLSLGILWPEVNFTLSPIPLGRYLCWVKSSVHENLHLYKPSICVSRQPGRMEFKLLLIERYSPVWNHSCICYQCLGLLPQPFHLIESFSWQIQKK